MLRGDNPVGIAFYSAVYSVSGYFHIDPYWGSAALGFLHL
jgi:hypothetical protein